MMKVVKCCFNCKEYVHSNPFSLPECKIRDENVSPDEMCGEYGTTEGYLEVISPGGEKLDRIKFPEIYRELKKVVYDGGGTVERYYSCRKCGKIFKEVIIDDKVAEYILHDFKHGKT